MKDRKKFVFLLMFPLVFMLTSCVPSNKQTLINYLDKISHQEEMQQSFKMKLTKLNLEDSDDDKGTQRILKTLVKDGSLSGNYYYDGSNFHADFKLKAVGENVPFEMFGNDKKLYLKADTINSVYKAAQDFDSDLSGYNFSKLSGKYIDVFDLAKEADLLTSSQVKEYQNSQKMVMNYSKNSFSAYKDVIKSLPDSAVTKKDDVITTTFHKKDIVSLLEKYKKNMDESKDTKTNTIDQKDIDEFKKEFKEFDYTIRFNKKEETIKYIIYLKSVDNDEIEAQIDTKYDKLKEKISMPSKSKIIDKKTFVDEMSSIDDDDL